MSVQISTATPTTTASVRPTTTPAAAAPAPAATQSAPPAAQDSIALSQDAQRAGTRTPTENLLMFGTDRKKVIETLQASGAKGENPKLGFFKNLGRKFLGLFGKDETETKQVGPDQSLKFKFKLKNYELKNLTLRTEDKENRIKRAIDFSTRRPNGKKRRDQRHR